ncbi:MAG: adenylyltransferase/cytidyltransferase family protein, partial [Defluviitaleaceae bacterium]|nr:adenylyltransferase/cytidyltransferase family protein [Defluviitaleaceae bacterium]
MDHQPLDLKNCKRIAVMGGTFDPIHNGHLAIAEAVRHRLKADRVVFIPSGRPPHKEGAFVSGCEHRYLMSVLA